MDPNISALIDSIEKNIEAASTQLKELRSTLLPIIDWIKKNPPRPYQSLSGYYRHFSNALDQSRTITLNKFNDYVKDTGYVILVARFGEYQGWMHKDAPRGGMFESDKFEEYHMCRIYRWVLCHPHNEKTEDYHRRCVEDGVNVTLSLFEYVLATMRVTTD